MNKYRGKISRGEKYLVDGNEEKKVKVIVETNVVDYTVSRGWLVGFRVIVYLREEPG